uniref:NADH-ubiquinone oxidoreductase chain 6 n=1 Tax=Leimacomys buettneri TaxID=3151849 RepID=A0AAU7YTE3_9RODE
MTNYIYILSLLFLMGCLGLALKPSPIYGGLVLVVSGCLGCFMVLCSGGSFLGLVVFLVYLGGMLVVFGYTAAMAMEKYPETWASSWLFLGTFMLGFSMELALVYFFVTYNVNVDVIVNNNMNTWAVYDVDDLGLMGEGGAGVAAMYSCTNWLMIVATWSLFVGVFVIIEITRG